MMALLGTSLMTVALSFATSDADTTEQSVLMWSTLCLFVSVVLNSPPFWLLAIVGFAVNLGACLQILMRRSLHFRVTQISVYLMLNSMVIPIMQEATFGQAVCLLEGAFGQVAANNVMLQESRT